MLQKFREEEARQNMTFKRLAKMVFYTRRFSASEGSESAERPVNGEEECYEGNEDEQPQEYSPE